MSARTGTCAAASPTSAAAEGQELKEPVVPNFRALPLVRVLTVGGSGAGRADRMAAGCGTAPAVPARLRDAIPL
jgi:hypothetical protein